MTRLIDADALWTSVVQSRKETIIDDDVKISMGEFVKLLDNAPTVELFCSYLSDGEVKQPCVEAPCDHERPRGEWKCNPTYCYKCNQTNCKADMRETDNDNNYRS